jgi:hypothetical protein
MRRLGALIDGMKQAALVAAVFTALAIQPSGAAGQDVVKIAVFDFELKDTSAVASQDAIDTGYLRDATEEARSRLSASGRYSVVDTGSVADDVASAGGVLNCNGCDGPLADRLGADQSLVGYVTRVSRTEYTVSLLVRDARTGEVISRGFTGLRLGANYAWPRGVSWLMDKWVPEAQAVE